ncbi:hypothetical protein [Streptomyces chryseus]
MVRPTGAALVHFANGLEPPALDGDSADDGSESIGAATVSFDAQQASTYLRIGAATWAVSNWNEPSVDDQDCTNFVSRESTLAATSG